MHTGFDPLQVFVVLYGGLVSILCTTLACFININTLFLEKKEKNLQLETSFRPVRLEYKPRLIIVVADFCENTVADD